MNHSNTISVIIADDHEIIRDAIDSLMSDIAKALGHEYKCLAYAKNGIEAITSIKSKTPDVIFLDVNMPLASGAEIIKDIHHWSPSTKIIIFTGVTAPGLLSEIVASGVDGLFSKGSDLEILREKFPLIMRGAKFIAPDLIDYIDQSHESEHLTKRERQVLNRIVSGLSNKQIGDDLCISPKTVDKHRTSLMTKLNVHSVAQLVKRSIIDGLVDAES